MRVCKFVECFLYIFSIVFIKELVIFVRGLVIGNGYFYVRFLGKEELFD